MASSTAPVVTGGPVETDAVVIGAGPVGLYAAFQFGLLEVRTAVVDALPFAGGQCAQLYADKPIYDIPALPAGTGRELVDRLLRQVAPFDVPLHLGRPVASVAPDGQGRWTVATDGGPRFLCRAVVIAAGVGAFLPRRLDVEGLDAFRGSQLHEHPDAEALAAWPDGDTVVVGGDAAALEVAVALATTAPGGGRRVTLLHRRAVIDAPAEALATMRALCDAGRMRFSVGRVAAAEATGGRLHHLVVTPPEGDDLRVPVDALAVCLGLVPQLGPLATWGVALRKKQVPVDTATFSTDVAGIHAIGDVVTYPGKLKLIACGFHEATLAAYAVAARLRGGAPVPLQYTTTSARLHALLGVGPGASERTAALP